MEYVLARSQDERGDLLLALLVLRCRKPDTCALSRMPGCLAPYTCAPSRCVHNGGVRRKRLHGSARLMCAQ